jgi:hypothetical protein
VFFGNKILKTSLDKSGKYPEQQNYFFGLAGRRESGFEGDRNGQFLTDRVLVRKEPKMPVHLSLVIKLSDAGASANGRHISSSGPRQQKGYVE